MNTIKIKKLKLDMEKIGKGFSWSAFYIGAITGAVFAILSIGVLLNSFK